MEFNKSVLARPADFDCQIVKLFYGEAAGTGNNQMHFKLIIQ